MSITDYLLMRTPDLRLGPKTKKVRADSGKISSSRIAISFLGIVLGIIASFYVTGLRPATETGGSSVDQSQRGTAATQPSTPTPTPQTGITAPLKQPSPAPQPTVASDFSWNRFWKICLISLVICGITYQGLYYSLRLYQNEPAWLILFVAFQYGYFWQSVVKGVTTAIAST